MLWLDHSPVGPHRHICLLVHSREAFNVVGGGTQHDSLFRFVWLVWFSFTWNKGDLKQRWNVGLGNENRTSGLLWDGPAMLPFLTPLPNRRERSYLFLLFMNVFIEGRIPTPLHEDGQHGRNTELFSTLGLWHKRKRNNYLNGESGRRNPACLAQPSLFSFTTSLPAKSTHPLPLHPLSL